MEDTIFQQRTNLSALNERMYAIRNEIGKVIVGQHKMLDLLMIGLLCDGHILIEGVPGVAKTLTAKLMAKIIDVGFSRIQFTPDLMPSDVLGTSVFNPKVMEERQVTIDGVTHPMDFPFIVLATQNPIEQEGTYRLRKHSSTGSCSRS